jgi:hypothetical protein
VLIQPLFFGIFASHCPTISPAFHTVNLAMHSTFFILVTALVSPAVEVKNLDKPKPGVKERTEILNALRPVVEKDLGQKVLFQVERLRSNGEWALFFGRPLRPDGKAIDFTKTHYKEAMDMGVFDGDSTQALLQLKKGKWTVRTFVIGPTDVAWSGWMAEPYFAPKEIFPAPFNE